MQFSMAVCEPAAFVAVQMSEQPAPINTTHNQTTFSPSFLPKISFFSLYSMPAHILHAARASIGSSAAHDTEHVADNSDLC